MGAFSIVKPYCCKVRMSNSAKVKTFEEVKVYKLILIYARRLIHFTTLIYFIFFFHGYLLRNLSKLTLFSFSNLIILILHLLYFSSVCAVSVQMLFDNNPINALYAGSLLRNL